MLARRLCLLFSARALSAAVLPGVAQPATKLLSQAEAIAVDEDLMATPGYSVDQLMELAGLSVAAAVFKAYPPQSHKRVLLACGPGNNGGDGLVAARHLLQFGYEVGVVYPKRPSKPLFVNLAEQMKMNGIPLLIELPQQPNLDTDYDLLVDAVFGFTFAGAVRAPFDVLLQQLKESSLPLLSVDIPSGWDVERGPGDTSTALQPETLISLTMPKRCAAHFEGTHYLGGRFVPATISEKYGFEQPAFPGMDQVVLLHGPK